MKNNIKKTVLQKVSYLGLIQKNSYKFSLLSILFITFLISSTLLIASTKESSADIYKFVTIDGVEAFTDAPTSKEATVVIKDKSSNSKKSRKSKKREDDKKINLEEIIAKAVENINADQFPTENSKKSFEIHLPPVGGKISSTVGMRIDPIDRKWRMHNGIDIAINEGTAVKPAADGVVIYSGTRQGYGNTVVIEHENGVITLYAHNSRILVHSGDPVTTSTTIALSGNTGRSTGPHLHFEAWQNGKNVTPAFMPDSSEPVSTKLASSITPQTRSSFRKEILSDGTILFTNIP